MVDTVSLDHFRFSSKRETGFHFRETCCRKKAHMQKPGSARLFGAQSERKYLPSNADDSRSPCLLQAWTFAQFQQLSGRSLSRHAALSRELLFGRTKPGQYRQISCVRACDAGRAPFPWQDASGLQHRPEQPSDNLQEGPTSRGIHPASCCNGSSGGASAT